MVDGNECEGERRGGNITLTFHIILLLTKAGPEPTPFVRVLFWVVLLLLLHLLVTVIFGLSDESRRCRINSKLGKKNNVLHNLEGHAHARAHVHITERGASYRIGGTNGQSHT